MKSIRILAVTACLVFGGTCVLADDTDKGAAAWSYTVTKSRHRQRLAEKPVVKAADCPECQAAAKTDKAVKEAPAVKKQDSKPVEKTVASTEVKTMVIQEAPRGRRLNSIFSRSRRSGGSCADGSCGR